MQIIADKFFRGISELHFSKAAIQYDFKIL